MIFNSIAFFIFLPLVFILYWFATNKNLKAQNLLVVFSSYIFYGWWDWRFIFLLAFSTLFGFFIGIQLSKQEKERNRKILLYASIIVNIGLLGFFKYFNFFIESFVEAFSMIGYKINISSLNIILPVGISFYTFQKLSYTIDVYRKDMEPSKNIIAFFAFVSFFPQLLAGPIERATELLPQFYKKRTFDYAFATDGMRQMLLGFFKKIVIADNCAIYVNDIFENYTTYSGSTLVLGVILFSFQVYADFSGYSDIAIGCAKLFGIKLNTNFLYPYFSTSITETWRRWHISLSSWVKDYLYMPLVIATRNWGKMGIAFSLILSFTIIGLWHGAKWTFIIYGLLQGIALSYEALTTKVRKNIFNKIPKFASFIIGIFFTQLFWLFTLVFFRSESISRSLLYLKRIIKTFSTAPGQLFLHIKTPTVFFIVLLLIFEAIQKNKLHVLQLDGKSSQRPFLRWAIYFIISLLIIFFGYYGKDSEFIYFQF